MAVRKIDALLCTVGTSVLGHWYDFANNEWRRKDVHGIVVDSYEKLKHALLRLEREDPSASKERREFGAEINSTASLFARGVVDKLRRVVFLVSDTEEGQKVGELLVHFFSNSTLFGLKRDDCAIEKIEGLSHSDEKVFKNKGLRNLVKKMAEWVRKLKGQGLSVGINATGGYKAQIAFAVLIGQAMKVDVFYMFEKFNHIIELPPMPVSFDIEVWEKYCDLLLEAENELIINAQNLPDDAIVPSLFDIEDDCAMLSPVGQVFVEAFRDFIYREVKSLPASNVPLAKRISLGEHNLSKFGEALQCIEKLAANFDFISRITDKYYNPDLSTRTCFRVPPDARQKGEGVLEFVFSSRGRTAKFDIYTTAKSQLQLHRALLELESWLNEEGYRKP